MGVALEERNCGEIGYRYRARIALSFAKYRFAI